MASHPIDERLSVVSTNPDFCDGARFGYDQALDDRAKVDAATDAVAELCEDDHHIVTRRADRTSWCVERYDKWGEESACGYGPDPQSAARACLEAIKAGSGKAGG